MRKISLRRLEAALKSAPKNKKTDPRRHRLSCRPATHPLRVRLSRTERHRAGRAGRRVESGRQGERRGHHHRPAGDAAGRPAGGAADRASGGPGRHHLLDRSDARRPAPDEAGIARAAADRRSADDGRHGIEKALGMQQISVERRAGHEPFRPRAGGGRLSHEALAMAFDPSPVRGLPSYLQMVKPGAAHRASRRGSGWSRSTRPCCATPTGWRWSCAARA